MATRVKKSFSSLHRALLFSSSTPRYSPFHTFQRTPLNPRYFGSVFGKETPKIIKGQTNSLPSVKSGFIYQLCENYRMFQATQSFYRSYASTSRSKPPQGTQTEGKKDLSTVEDPFDSPTYHIPEKPVTFTEGASYSVVILVGLGIAAAAAYGVFKELIIEPKEYKIFNKALQKIQNDSQVRVRIGSPIKGYGQESRNRAARQRIPHRIWTDEDGQEHIEVNFHVRGSNGDGKVYCEMFKDKSDNQWKYQYLIIDILHPSPMQLMLESYLPTA